MQGRKALGSLLGDEPAAERGAPSPWGVDMERLIDHFGVFVPAGHTAEGMRDIPDPPQIRSVSHDFLQTLGVRLVAGRWLEPRVAREGAFLAVQPPPTRESRLPRRSGQCSGHNRSHRLQRDEWNDARGAAASHCHFRLGEVRASSSIVVAGQRNIGIRDVRGTDDHRNQDLG